MDSFVETLELYKEELGQVNRGATPDLPNTNFDTGAPGNLQTDNAR